MPCLTGRVISMRTDPGRIERYPGTHLLYQRDHPVATLRGDTPALERALEAATGIVTVCGEDRGYVLGLPHMHVTEVRPAPQAAPAQRGMAPGMAPGMMQAPWMAPGMAPGMMQAPVQQRLPYPLVVWPDQSGGWQAH